MKLPNLVDLLPNRDVNCWIRLCQFDQLEYEFSTVSSVIFHSVQSV